MQIEIVTSTLPGGCQLSINYLTKTALALMSKKVDVTIH